MKNQNPNIEKSYRTLSIVWMILLLSQATLIGVVFMVKPEVFKFDFSAPLLDENAIIIIAFAFLAIINFVLSFLIKNRCNAQAVIEQKIQFVQTGLIIACALCETISLLGMVLAFAFSYQYFFAWFALGIFGIIFNFPRRADLIAASYKK